MRSTWTVPANAGLKLLAFFIALVLWYVASPQKDEEEVLSVPIELVHVPPRLTVAAPPRSIQVVIAGPRPFWRLSAGSRVKGVLDLKELGPGTVTFDSRAAVRLAPGYRILRIQPSTIDLKLTEVR